MSLGSRVFRNKISLLFANESLKILLNFIYYLITEILRKVLDNFWELVRQRTEENKVREDRESNAFQ